MGNRNTCPCCKQQLPEEPLLNNLVLTNGGSEILSINDNDADLLAQKEFRMSVLRDVTGVFDEYFKNKKGGVK